MNDLPIAVKMAKRMPDSPLVVLDAETMGSCGILVMRRE